MMVKYWTERYAVALMAHWIRGFPSPASVDRMFGNHWSLDREQDCVHFMLCPALQELDQRRASNTKMSSTVAEIQSTVKQHQRGVKSAI